MKLCVAFAIIPAVSAFSSTILKAPVRSDVKLDMATRRDAFLEIAGLAMAAAVVQPALALDTFPADNEIVKEQQTVTDKLDVNNAAVADYMQLPGMYPGIAGKIANNGPYGSVKDVYKLKVLSKAEIKQIKEYEKVLCATPPTGLDTLRGRDPYRKTFNK
mmetsp:Transcript_5449/g.12425  ORF Transcript_5449/g.12425 Transcript_5449/m.12425 type:complete len:160 (+) Transcript_5449:137-616(+)